MVETGDGFNLERHLQDIERSHLERALERVRRRADTRRRRARPQLPAVPLSDEEARHQARMRFAVPRRNGDGDRAGRAIYLLRLDDAAGLIVDDAWYIVLAKALGAGEGYRLDQLGDDADPAGRSARVSGAPVAGVPRQFRRIPTIAWLKSISMLAVAGLGCACWSTSPAIATYRRLHAGLLVAANDR